MIARVALTVAAAALLAGASPAGAAVIDGNARFEVVSPTLVRVEYAADKRFEDRPTLNVPARSFKAPPFTVTRSAGVLRIRTALLTLSYKRGSGPFTPANLAVKLRVGSKAVNARPSFPPAPAPSAGPPSLSTSPYAVKEDAAYKAPTSGNLGGWYRGLDTAGQPVALHDGLLSRAGWYLLDDSSTVLVTSGSPGFAVRPSHGGAYQDGYFFGYGRDYARGLKDLRTLTGPAPLLPRNAFGVWFSRYFPYKQSDYAPLLARFASEKVPLNVLMVDTDFKAPHAWNGWSFADELFPDPGGFFAWAKGKGLSVSLNVHPSISSDDPGYAQAVERAGGSLRADPNGVRCKTFITIGDAYAQRVPGGPPPTGCSVFDWAKGGDLAAYFGLHQPLEREGLDFWWLDYCCDESYALAPGLTQDTWINQLYARRNASRGSRWPVLSRVGASVFEPNAAGGGIWAEHRNSIHFTGDSRPTWSMLDFQTLFSASEGNAGIPYVSHDIGGFGSITTDGVAGRHLTDDLYVRWVQSGAFQPILRLHSDHGDRLPWEYPGAAQRIATKFLQLRGALVPYTYTLAREAYDSGLPLNRRMFLQWPASEDAYRFDRQFMLGRDLLVAPVGTSGNPATKDVWFPPGAWTDIFTGQRIHGPAVRKLSVPLDRMPVFAREGAIVPMQGYRPQGDVTPPARLTLEAYAGARGSFTLYEDQGDGLAYKTGRSARTRFSQARAGRTVTVTIGAARGSFTGMPKARTYELRVHGVRRKPRSVTLGAKRLRFTYDAATKTVTTTTPSLSTARAASVVAG
jgi:alpha-glucosidase (family GH31 glycosyl hydrolase)